MHPSERCRSATRVVSANVVCPCRTCRTNELSVCAVLHRPHPRRSRRRWRTFSSAWPSRIWDRACLPIEWSARALRNLFRIVDSEIRKAAWRHDRQGGEFLKSPEVKAGSIPSGVAASPATRLHEDAEPAPKVIGMREGLKLAHCLRREAGWRLFLPMFGGNAAEETGLID